MTGNTYTEGEKDAMLDRDSAFGGAVNREMAGMAGVVFSKDGSFVHEFSPRVRTNNPQNQFVAPGTVIFNHNHIS